MNGLRKAWPEGAECSEQHGAIQGGKKRRHAGNPQHRLWRSRVWVQAWQSLFQAGKQKMMVLLSEAVGYRSIDAHAPLESSPLIACNG